MENENEDDTSKIGEDIKNLGKKIGMLEKIIAESATES